MGVLSKLKLLPKKFTETKQIDNICVSSAEAWFVKIQYGNYRPFVVRFDVAIGDSVKDEIFNGTGAFLREGENATISYETHTISCAVITFVDGSQEIRDLSPCDQDLPAGTFLEPELCHTYYKHSFISGKNIYYQNVKEIHYKGMNYVNDWIETSSARCSDHYSSSTIQSMEVVPGEEGWEVLITFTDNTQISLSVDERSRLLTKGEFLFPQNCTIIKKRLYHTIERLFILVS